MERFRVPNSVAFIQSELSRGLGLAQLATAIDLSQGDVEAFLPRDRAAELVASFETGAMVDVADQRAAVQALAADLVGLHGVTTSPTASLVSQFADAATVRPAEPERPLWRFSTAWLEGSPKSYQDGELWLVDRSNRPEGLASLLEEALWFPALAVVLDPSPVDHEVEVVNAQRLAGAVRDAGVLLCGAWGATNYLIWTRRSNRSSR